MARDTGDQSPAVRGALAAALFMLAAHVASKATRDALFLSLFPVTDLPRAMIAAALVSLASAIGMSRLLARVGPFRLVPAAFAFSALLFAAEWLLLGVAPGLAVFALYLHSAAFGALLVSGFWSVANERFDPHAGRRTFARIGSFAALGGVLGGVLAGRLSGLLGVPAMLLVLAVLHLGCAAAIFGVGAGRAASAATAPEPEGTSALRRLREWPLLLQMGALVGVLAIVDALLDYALKSEAAAALAGREALIRFFAVFYTAAGLVSFALQASLGPRILRGLGLGGAIALTPSVVLLVGGVAGVFTRLWTVALARGAAFAATNSFFRSGFELLYTPIPPAVKRPTKAWIDVGAQRLGDLAGGGLILALLALVPGLPTRVVLGLAASAAVVALWLVVRLHRGYVKALAESLREGTIRLVESESLDATTARTLADTRVTIDRAELLARIRELQRSHGGPGEPAAVRGRDAPGAADGLAGYFDRVSALASGDAARARAALAERRDEVALVPHVLPLLAGFDLRENALEFLRRVAPRVVGQLGDALLDADQSPLVRRGIPRALEVAPSPRAVDALCRALEDSDFEVRFQCGRAAARLLARESGLRPAPEVAWAAASRELAADAWTWERQGRRRTEAGSDDSVLLDAGSLASVSRSLEHVFTLFALALDAELMGFALRGLHAADANLRGTAREYLEATLPEPVRRALWPRLPGEPVPPRPKRAPAEIADELLRTSTMIRR